jgi:geranylgeranyl diphosphate synthase type II
MDAASSSRLVRAMLVEYGAIVQSRLRAFLDTMRGEGERYLYDLASDYPARGGRWLRAALCMAMARLHGGTLEESANSAVALEILHNAFLVHDDVEDESEERRGRPTMHLLHGVPVAVNVGDALAVLSLRPLMDNRRSVGTRIALRVLEETERAARESVEGQAIELKWRGNNSIDLDESDYLTMILKKTCWYTTIYPCRVGALIGTRDGAPLDSLLRFGFFLGAAFQIQDDLLNLIGNHERYGKEISGDLSEGKRTLMLIQLYQRATVKERARLRAVLGLPRAARTSEVVGWIRDRMTAYGCVEDAQKVAHGLAGAAQHEFSLMFGHLPDSREKRFVEALPVWVLNRA